MEVVVVVGCGRYGRKESVRDRSEGSIGGEGCGGGSSR